MTGIVGWLFAEGHAVDGVLVVMLGELAWLVAVSGWAPATAALRLLPGALMVLALKAALVGADWTWIAGTLALSLPAHLLDLRLGRPASARLASPRPAPEAPHRR